MFQKWFFPHDDKKNHFKPLDGLRGLAVLLVMLSHSSNAGLLFHEQLNFAGSGKAGVFLFFILSAYLLDRQIALAFLNQKANSAYWKRYFFRRFFRIYPLYFVALLTYFFFNFIDFIPTKINEFSYVPEHLFLLEGKTIFWSIPVEFKYYFLSPLIMWFCNKYLKWNYLRVSLFILVLTVLAFLIDNRFNLKGISTIKYLPIFLAGTIISIYELVGKAIFKNISVKFFDVLGVFALFMIFLSLPNNLFNLFDIEIKLHKSPFYVIYIFIWSLLLFSAKYSNGIIKNLLCFKPLRFLGSISFSLYLFHSLAIPFVKNIVKIPANTQVYIFFIVSIIISSITYLLIELPISKIKFKG